MIKRYRQWVRGFLILSPIIIIVGCGGTPPPTAAPAASQGKGDPGPATAFQKKAK